MDVCLDVGASNMRIAEVSKTRIKGKQQVDNPKKRTDVKKALVSLITNYADGRKVKSISMGFAGLLNDGKIINSPNMVDLDGLDLKSFLRSKFRVPVYIDNDAHCAGLAERYYGAGKSYKNFFLLTYGTGIGGAAFIDGKLYKGSGIGMEPGHILIRRKRFESIAAGPASVSLARKKGMKVTSLELAALAHRGNKKALSVYEEIGTILGEGLLSLTYVYDPEAIIIGGGFSRVKFIWPPMLSVLHEQDIGRRRVKVLKAKFGPDAGLIGAGLLSKVSK